MAVELEDGENVRRLFVQICKLCASRGNSSKNNKHHLQFNLFKRDNNDEQKLPYNCHLSLPWLTSSVVFLQQQRGQHASWGRGGGMCYWDFY